MKSCRNVIFYYGKFRVINRQFDNSLVDSVLVFGKVFDAIDTISPKIHSRIWTNELTKDAYSDNKGSYSLKLARGTYTVNCREDYGTDEFKETIKDIS